MSIDPTLFADLPLGLKVQIHENLYRKDLTQSELATVQRDLIKHFSARTQQGKRNDLQPARTCTEGSVHVGPKGRRENSTEKVARIFRESGRTTNKRLAVVEAAERNPRKYGALLKTMDRSGSPNGAFQRLTVLRGAEQIRKEPPPLPGRGPYRTIVADPPWSYAEGG